MPGTVQEFLVDLSRFEALGGKHLDLFVKGFTQTVFNEIQSGGKYSPGTPIRTGFARANWTGGIGSAPAATVAPPVHHTPGERAGAAAAAAEQLTAIALSARAGDVVVMANSAPYIGKLEHGSSQQAPGGFIGMALLEGQQMANEVAAHVVGTP